MTDPAADAQALLSVIQLGAWEVGPAREGLERLDARAEPPCALAA